MENKCTTANESHVLCRTGKKVKRRKCLHTWIYLLNLKWNKIFQSTSSLWLPYLAWLETVFSGSVHDTFFYPKQTNFTQRKSVSNRERNRYLWPSFSIIFALLSQSFKLKQRVRGTQHTMLCTKNRYIP